MDDQKSRKSRRKEASSGTGIAQSQDGSPSLDLGHLLARVVLVSDQRDSDSISDVVESFPRFLTGAGSLSALSYHSAV
jgi:hypothetical protein